jgi:ribonuclease HI
MLVTINTDASYHPEHRIGAFSFWMVCNQGRHFGAGPLRGIIHHSHEAEFKAVLNALHFLVNKTDWRGVEWVIINTDNQEVFEMINGGPTREWARELKASFNALRRDMKAKIEARKVKAHSGTEEKRKWVNNWCDKSAKQMLNSLINESKI